MAYTALYRKYRPATFDKLIGQEHIVRTLTNQIEGDKVGHAYLFTGSRGTGKTSAAKIFAKAVNCLKPEKGSPCGKCASCAALSDPANLDVLEIDAASNNRVDEIRELREKVKYPPVSVRYKIYIIDEVHMLTDSAFNALLKTLEEPPSYCIFILATTEAHKLPATILSRCMRFDFRLVASEKIAAVLTEIFKDIKKPFEPDAVNVIAAAAEGSVRDALSIADMCVSFTGKKLTAPDVLEVLGAADTGTQFTLCDAITSGKPGGVLKILDTLISGGKAASIVAKDMAGHFRNLLVIKTCGVSEGILPLPKEIINRYSEQCRDISFEKLYECAEGFAKLDAELRFSASPRILLEALCLKLCMGAGDNNEKAQAAPQTRKAPAAAAEKKTEESYNAAAGYGPESPSGAEARAVWGRVVTALREEGTGLLFAVAADKSGVRITGKTLILTLSDENDFNLMNKPVNISTINGILEGDGLSFQPEYRQKKEKADEYKKVKELGGDSVRFNK